MINSQHFRRLEHIYADKPMSPREMNNVAVSMGRAELSAQIDTDQLSPQAIANHAHYHDMLADAASLAAGSLVEDHVVVAEQFDMHVLQPGYSGPVTASARVAIAQPPRFRVEVQLVNEEGEVLARGSGVFAPSAIELPPDPDPDQEVSSGAKPEPAVYASVWPTPFGFLHLN